MTQDSNTPRLDPALAAGNRRSLAAYKARHFQWQVNGSVATITGNPQNMIIGSLSHIPYASFAFALSPVAVVSLVIAFCLIAVSHREEFFRSGRFAVEADSGLVVYHRRLVIKTVAVLAAMVVLFFAGQPVAEAATRRVV